MLPEIISTRWVQNIPLLFVAVASLALLISSAAYAQGTEEYNIYVPFKVSPRQIDNARGLDRFGKPHLKTIQFALECEVYKNISDARTGQNPAYQKPGGAVSIRTNNASSPFRYIIEAPLGTDANAWRCTLWGTDPDYTTGARVPISVLTTKMNKFDKTWTATKEVGCIYGSFDAGDPGKTC